MPEDSRLRETIIHNIDAHQGWLPFDQFMASALYTPGLGYYSNSAQQFGTLPQSGSDFITAPELSPLFGQAFAQQLQQALHASGSAEIWEFGAGSGALAASILTALGHRLERYVIIDLSATLREQQRQTIARHAPEHAHRVQWLDMLPDAVQGVVIGNEVLDAMPVKLLHRHAGKWFERGVIFHAFDEVFAWEDRPTALRPPVEIEDEGDYLTELGLQAQGFMRTLGEHMTCGAAFFIDYGFPEREFYHPQRSMGTLMCHHQHQADSDPLTNVGHKDITAHVDFTGVALAAQDAGFTVLGYTSQARFLFNCGLLNLMPKGDDTTALKIRSASLKLVTEHEMGEIFKVIAFTKGCDFDAIGFVDGDRTHTL